MSPLRASLARLVLIWKEGMLVWMEDSQLLPLLRTWCNLRFHIPFAEHINHCHLEWNRLEFITNAFIKSQFSRRKRNGILVLRLYASPTFAWPRNITKNSRRNLSAT